MGAGLGDNLSDLVTFLGNYSAVNFPSFDGKGESAAGHITEVQLWNHITPLDGPKRGSALQLQIAARAPRKFVWLRVSPTLISVDGTKDVTKELKANHDPDALFGKSGRGKISTIPRSRGNY